MNNLFELKEEKITLNPLVLSIQEFEKIWKRDKSKGKLKALKELTYVYGMCSIDEDNIWKDYPDLNKRSKTIIEDLWGSELEWSPDRLISKAIDKYKSRFPLSPGELLLETLMKAMMDIRDFISKINYEEKDNAGRLIHNPKNILDLAKKATDTFIEIEETIEKIKARKKLSSDKIKGGGEEGLFEDTKMMKDFT